MTNPTSAEVAIDWVESHNKVLTNIEWIGIFEALKAEIERLKKDLAQQFDTH